MWVREIILNNIQSFKDERISFSKGINVIIGKNNAGKSCIIRALYSLQSNPQAKDISLLRKHEAEGFAITIFDDAVGELFEKGKKHSNRQAAVFFNARNVGIWNFHMPKKIRGTTALMNHFHREVQKKKHSTFSKFKEEENVFIPFFSKRKTQYFSGQLDKATIKKIDTDFKSLPTKLHLVHSGTLKQKFESYCDRLLGFTPVMLATQQHGMLDAGHGFGPGKDDQISLDQMGDGVLQITALLVNLLTEKGKIFLIEELESDLHPSALKTLLEIIKEYSKHNQFIITTHSNIVLTSLCNTENSQLIEVRAELEKDSENMIELFSATSAIVQNNPNERIRILQELGYELTDHELWSGFLILEESSAQIVIKHFLLPAFFPKIADKLNVISAKGADDVPARFIELHRIFTYIHSTPIYKSKAWAILDGDNAGKGAIEKLRITNAFNSSWAESHLMTFDCPDFENYYPSKYKTRIEKILNEQDSKKRGILKNQLASEIVQSYKSKPKETVRAFKQSAKEVIQKLDAIQKGILDRR